MTSANIGDFFAGTSLHMSEKKFWSRSSVSLGLKDEVEMKLTDDEKVAHNNAWQSHRDVTDGLKKIRGKIYSLLL